MYFAPGAGELGMDKQTVLTAHSQGNIVFKNALSILNKQGKLVGNWSKELKKVFVNMTGSPVTKDDIEDQLAPVRGEVDGIGDNPGDPITVLGDKGVVTWLKELWTGLSPFESHGYQCSDIKTKDGKTIKTCGSGK